MNPFFNNDLLTMSLRSICGNLSCINLIKSLASLFDVVTTPHKLSVPCSACANRSLMINSLSALLSAIISNSEGPAGKSIPTSSDIIFLA